MIIYECHLKSRSSKRVSLTGMIKLQGLKNAVHEVWGLGRVVECQAADAMCTWTGDR